MLCPGFVGARLPSPSIVPVVNRATAKSRKTGRGVPAIPDRLEGSKTNWTRMDADQAVNPRTFSVHPRYFAFSVCIRRQRSPTAQFGQDRDFAVTLPS